MKTTTELPLFQQYQLQFSGHIRNPQSIPGPDRVAASRMRVYREIVFDNLESSLANCFPVCKKILGKRAWQKVVRGFFVHHQSHSPLFRQIPEEFLAYLDQAHTFEDVPRLPGFFTSLAHYEWIELAVAACESANDLESTNADGDLLQDAVVLTPTLRLLVYDYPVHRISSGNKPAAPLEEPVHLAVFRNLDDEVRFIEINQLTFRLLTLFAQTPASGKQVLRQIAEETRHPHPEVLIEFGLPILQALREQQLILGTEMLS